MDGKDYKKILTSILKCCGKPGQCDGCHATIYWMVSNRGRYIPYNEEGEAHFSDCPQADQFRKARV